MLGIYLAFKHQLVAASFCVVGAAIADFFDGMVARLLKSDTKIGKDLDSLADLVSFGATPVFIYINLYLTHWSFGAKIDPLTYTATIGELANNYWAILPTFLIVIFLVYRIANTSKRAINYFFCANSPPATPVLSRMANTALVYGRIFCCFIVFVGSTIALVCTKI